MGERPEKHEAGSISDSCNIVGSVRLDDGEYIGSEPDIRHKYCMSIAESDSSEGASEGVGVVESSRTADGDQVSSQCQPVSAGVKNSDETHPISAVGSTTEDAEAASIEDCAGVVQHASTQIHAESDDTDLPLASHKHHDVKAHRQLSNEKDTNWHCQNFIRE